MTTFWEPIRRRGWFIDGEGIVTFPKREDETITYTIDFTDALGTSETLSSITTDVSGVTLNSSAVATPNVTLSVSGTSGSIKVTATTSTSRVLERVVRFIDKSPQNQANDYRYST